MQLLQSLGTAVARSCPLQPHTVRLKLALAFTGVSLVTLHLLPTPSPLLPALSCVPLPPGSRHGTVIWSCLPADTRSPRRPPALAGGPPSACVFDRGVYARSKQSCRSVFLLQAFYSYQLVFVTLYAHNLCIRAHGIMVKSAL